MEISFLNKWPTHHPTIPDHCLKSVESEVIKESSDEDLCSEMLWKRFPYHLTVKACSKQSNPCNLYGHAPAMEP